MGGPGGDDAPGAGAPSSSRAPDILETLRQLKAAGRASASAAGDAGKAFRKLLSADISLARSAMGRAVAFISVAIVFGASAWLMLMTALVITLVLHLDWPWPLALIACALLSLVVTAYGAWRAMYYFEHTRLRATRRQLARLGFGELADYTPGPGSPESTREATDRLAEGERMKDKQGIDVTPP